MLAESTLISARRELESLLADTGARSALIADPGGHLVLRAGQPATFDEPTFAAVAAADLGANERLAQLLGIPAGEGVLHEGRDRSLHLRRIGPGSIAVVFDRGVELGLVRIRSARAVAALERVLPGARPATPALEPAWAAEAVEEVDRLFRAG